MDRTKMMSTKGAFGSLGHMIQCSGGGNIFKLWQMLDGQHATHILEMNEKLITVTNIYDGVVCSESTHQVPDVSGYAFTTFCCFEYVLDSDVTAFLRFLTTQHVPQSVFVCICKQTSCWEEQGFAWILPNVLLLRSYHNSETKHAKWTDRCCDFLFATGFGYNRTTIGTIAYLSDTTPCKKDWDDFCSSDDKLTHTHTFPVWNALTLQNDFFLKKKDNQI